MYVHSGAAQCPTPYAKVTFSAAHLMMTIQPSQKEEGCALDADITAKPERRRLGHHYLQEALWEVIAAAVPLGLVSICDADCQGHMRTASLDGIDGLHRCCAAGVGRKSCSVRREQLQIWQR